VSFNTLILIASVFAASFVQGASGFGYAMVMMPVLLWLDFSLADAIILSAVPSVVQVGLGCYQLREHLRWGIALKALVIRVLGIPIGLWILRTAGIPIGLWILGRLELLSSSQIKQIIGLILLVVILLQLSLKIKPRDHLHPFWGVLAFLGSGIMQGVSSIGGPLTVLWVMAQTWSNQVSRGFILHLLLLTLPIHLLLLYMSYGKDMLAPVIQSIWLLPVVVLGTYVGVVVGNRISKAQLRTVTYALLLFLAISSVLSPFLA